MPNGLFVFDLNREEAYRERWTRLGSVIDNRVVSVSRGRFLPEKGLALCDIVLLRKENSTWNRSDFQLRQRLYRREAVLAALTRQGFDACVHDAAQAGMPGDFAYGRDFYVSRKPRL